jgi:hypothetical protein
MTKSDVIPIQQAQQKPQKISWQKVQRKTLEKPEPRDLDAEKQLLGSLFIEASLMYEALKYFSPDDFYKPSNQKIFSAIRELMENPAEMFSGAEIDMVLVKDFLQFKGILEEVGGIPYIAEIWDSTPTAANITYYAKKVHSLAERRRILHSGLAAAYACYDENIPLEDIRESALTTIQGDSDNLTAIKIDLSCTEEDERPLITLDNSMLLAKGDLMGIVSGIGKGKSNIGEVIASLFQNRYCEPQGKLQVIRNHPQGQCIYVDTERSKNECIRSIRRMKRRIDIEGNKELVQGDDFTFFKFYSIIGQETPTKKYQEFLRLLHTTPHLELVILDGILDIFTNLNDLDEATIKVHQLFALANKIHFGLLFTIHENRNDSSGKGMGHVGGVVQRKASAFLRLRRDKENPDIRILDTDFENMKVRAGHDQVRTAFSWNPHDGMFHEVPYVPQAKPKGRAAIDLEQTFEWAFLGFERMTAKELREEYSKKHQVSLDTARVYMSNAKKEGIIEKRDGYYVLVKSKDLY